MNSADAGLTIAAIIESCGGYRAVAEDLGLVKQAVFQWNYHGIPIKYWDYVMKKSTLKKKVTVSVLYDLSREKAYAKECKKLPD